MPKALRCREVGVDGDFSATADTEEEMFNKAADHARTAHGMAEIPAGLLVKVRAASATPGDGLDLTAHSGDSARVTKGRESQRDEATRLRPLLREVIYGRLHRLQEIGSILRVSSGRYRGRPLTLPDGTVLRWGDLIGRLHFHNPRIAALHSHVGNPGFRFITELKRSLQVLASLAAHDPRYGEVKAWGGPGPWQPGLAQRLGFQPLVIQNPIRRFWLSRQFQVLRRHYGGETEPRLPPRDFWISTRELRRRYGGRA